MAVLGNAGPGAEKTAGPLLFTFFIFFLDVGPFLAIISAGPGAKDPLDPSKPSLRVLYQDWLLQAEGLN